MIFYHKNWNVRLKMRIRKKGINLRKSVTWKSLPLKITMILGPNKNIHGNFYFNFKLHFCSYKSRISILYVLIICYFQKEFDFHFCGELELPYGDNESPVNLKSASIWLKSYENRLSQKFSFNTPQKIFLSHIKHVLITRFSC